jgi:hypothetical protein
MAAGGAAGGDEPLGPFTKLKAGTVAEKAPGWKDFR